jgi:hypothetical protein
MNVLNSMFGLRRIVEPQHCRIKRWKLTETEVHELGKLTGKPDLPLALKNGHFRRMFGAQIILREQTK